MITPYLTLKNIHLKGISRAPYLHFGKPASFQWFPKAMLRRDRCWGSAHFSDLPGHLEITWGLLPNLLSHHSFSELHLHTKGLDSWFPNFCSQIPNFWSMCIKVYLLVIYKMTNMKRKLKRWDCHYSSKCFYFPCIPQWCRTFTSPRGVCIPLGRPQHWQRGFYFIPTWSPQSLVHRMHLKMLQWVTKDSNTPRDRIGTRNSGLLPTWDCQIQHSHHFKSFVQIWEGSREDTCFFFRLV